jgi:D-sedoheptulose 7-phosphate isomerase
MQDRKPQLTIVRPQTEDRVEQALQQNTAIRDSHRYFAHHGKVVRELPFADIERVVDVLHDAYQRGHRVFLFGNGGSAALASHFACDLGKGTAAVASDERRFRVLSLTDNIALITAWANDTSYDQVFAEQLRNFIEEGDIALGISGSGCSPNVLLALEVARQSGATTVGLTGFKGGKMPALCDICIIIPSSNMQIVEDFQLSTAHALFTVVRHRIAQDVSDKASSARSAA